MPTWDTPNLEGHCDKHAACFMAIHDLTKSELCTERYEALSHQCHRSHWMKYEAVAWDPEESCYRPLRRYFVDDHPAVACTTVDETTFVTYFHAHFGRKHCWVPPSDTTAGDKRLMYSEWVRTAEAGRQLQDLTVMKREL